MRKMKLGQGCYLSQRGIKFCLRFRKWLIETVYKNSVSSNCTNLDVCDRLKILIRKQNIIYNERIARLIVKIRRTLSGIRFIHLRCVYKDTNYPFDKLKSFHYFVLFIYLFFFFVLYFVMFMSWFYDFCMIYEVVDF